MKYVAFIGSRDLTRFSPEQITLYRSACLACVQHGYAVVTGACKGADQLAADTALQAGGRVLLVLPSGPYEGDFVANACHAFRDEVRVEVYDPALHSRWTESVRLCHPAFDRLGEVGIQMHARNFGIVGRSTAVVALPNYRKGGGGTAQGLRVAAALGIPAYDLRDERACQSLHHQLVGAPSAPSSPTARG